MRKLTSLRTPIAFCVASLVLTFNCIATIRYVDLNSLGPASPYTDWSTAATNIQDAIEASVAGDVVLVTNGVYTSGGKVKGGNLTNRVALDKPLTVQSVNGPSVTIIQGIWNPIVTNGPAAVRCAWLTNGAFLSGFTIRGGATRPPASGATDEMYGGGVFGFSTNAFVANCIIVSNTCATSGGGAYRVTLTNSTLIRNRAVGSGIAGQGFGNYGSGGGAASCNIYNCFIVENAAQQNDGGGTLNCRLKACALVRNSTFLMGSGASGGTLLNCTLTGNVASGYTSGYGGAVYNATLTNCIVWGNTNRLANSDTNYFFCTFTYCDTSPLPSGIGNIAADPQILADGYHLAEASICRGAGTNLIVGWDLDGQSWSNPPPIGCDEWAPPPTFGPAPVIEIIAGERKLMLRGVAAGQLPITYAWYRDDSLVQDDDHYVASATPNLVINRFGPEHAGRYQLVASNAFGISTSQVASVVMHCVDAGGAGSVAPYSTWGTAATRIQDAIDAALPGDIVLVTNGVYASGGKAVYGDLTNRVVLDKPLTVMSINGYAVTSIKGYWDPATTNGPLAVRCAWLTDGAVLSGFTLRDGATRGGNVLAYEQHCGAGAGSLTNTAIVANCVLTNNFARWYGGGAMWATLNNCLLVANRADRGGGTYNSFMNNCTVVNNYCSLLNVGAGTYFGIARNCIVTDNYSYSSFGPPTTLANHNSSSFAFSCTSPLPAGTGNTNVTPVFLDPVYHLPASSPLRSAGSSLYSTGVDGDGEA